jgi:hypothetical protein
MGLGSGIRDPRSGKNLFRIPDPGVKKAPDPGSGSATLFLGNTSNVHFMYLVLNSRENAGLDVLLRDGAGIGGVCVTLHAFQLKLCSKILVLDLYEYSSQHNKK